MVVEEERRGSKLGIGTKFNSCVTAGKTAMLPSYVLASFNHSRPLNMRIVVTS